MFTYRETLLIEIKALLNSHNINADIYIDGLMTSLNLFTNEGLEEYLANLKKAYQQSEQVRSILI